MAKRRGKVSLECRPFVPLRFHGGMAFVGNAFFSMDSILKKNVGRWGYKLNSETF